MEEQEKKFIVLDKKTRDRICTIKCVNNCTLMRKAINDENISNFDGNIWITYNPLDSNSRPLRNPRGPITPFLCQNGYYLLFFYNNGFTSTSNRSVYWLTAGREISGILQWSQPEIGLYDPDPSERGPGYPDFVEDSSGIWVVESQKTQPRFHLLYAPLISIIQSQWYITTVTTRGLVVNVSGSIGKVSGPSLPDLSTGDGFSLSLWITGLKDNVKSGLIILDAMDSSKKGLQIRVGNNNSVILNISDGQNFQSISTDEICGANLWDGQNHHLGFIVDGGPKVMSVIVDETLCDGGSYSPLGWTFFSSKMTTVNASMYSLAPNFSPNRLLWFRVYNVYLFTSEMIGNWRAGIPL